MSSYRIGYRFERRVRKHFEDQGYFVARQGKSSFPDLIVVNHGGEVTLVECKVNERQFSREEEEELVELRKRFQVDTLLAYREGRKLKFKEV